MKKLMIAAAIVCAAAFSQAAQYNWTGTYIYDGYDTGAAPVNGTAYLFLNGGDTTLAAITAAVQGGTFSASDYLDTTAFTAGTISKTTAEGVAGATGDSFFMVLVADKAGTDYAYVSPTYTPGIVETIGVTGLPFADPGTEAYGLLMSTYVSDNWYAQSVPEPTSGLLLLLGVAGLALRRRHA